MKGWRERKGVVLTTTVITDEEDDQMADNGDLILLSACDINVGNYVGVAWEEGCSFNNHSNN